MYVIACIGWPCCAYMYENPWPYFLLFRSCVFILLWAKVRKCLASETIVAFTWIIAKDLKKSETAIHKIIIILKTLERKIQTNDKNHISPSHGNIGWNTHMASSEQFVWTLYAEMLENSHGIVWRVCLDPLCGDVRLLTWHRLKSLPGPYMQKYMLEYLHGIIWRVCLDPICGDVGILTWHHLKSLPGPYMRRCWSRGTRTRLACVGPSPVPGGSSCCRSWWSRIGTTVQPSDNEGKCVYVSVWLNCVRKQVSTYRQLLTLVLSVTDTELVHTLVIGIDSCATCTWFRKRRFDL